MLCRDLSESLAALAKRNLGAYRNLAVANIVSVDWALGRNSFDLVLAAHRHIAFHPSAAPYTAACPRLAARSALRARYTAARSP
jgi:hypothetical protein